MNLLVDTSVWSLFLRRQKINDDNPYVTRLRYHLEVNDCIHLLGSILQELLDGIKEQKHFNVLRDYLAPFPLLELTRDDYIEASALRNRCRSREIQASPTDFLICASCIRRDFPLLTADNDFTYISAHCKIDLIPIHV